MPQPGYVHPDEYFQSIDVLLGDIFGVQSSRVWEFNKEFPIRNIFVPYVIYGVPLIILKYLIGLGYKIGAAPYLFVTLPRLMCCCISFLVDFSLYRICKLTEIDPKNYMIVLGSSYVMLLYGTRTFSNTIEMVLFAVLLYIVADCMKRAQNIRHQYEKLEDAKLAAPTTNECIRKSLAQKRLPSPSFDRCLPIATILAVGFYNRPTFVGYALTPIFFWLRRRIKCQQVNLWIFNYRIWCLMLASLPTVILLTLVDSVYYGYTTWEDVLNMKATIANNSYVVTPYNFFVYNVNKTNLMNHGLHPYYLHSLVNLPLLFNLLGVGHIVCIIFEVYRFYNRLPALQSIPNMLFFSSVVPLVFLSMFPHQEPRFIIPLILPIVFLHTSELYPPTTHSSTDTDSNTPRVRRSKLFLWYLCNVLFFIFYSYLHQGGTYHLMNRLSEVYGVAPKTEPLCVITSHTYSIPMSVIHAPHFKRSNNVYRSSKRIFLHNLGSSHSFDVIPTAVKAMQNVCKSSSKTNYGRIAPIYFIIPTILTGSLYDTAIQHKLSFTTDQIYYAHFSTEVLQNIFANSSNFSNGVSLSTRYDTYSDISEQSLLDYIGLSIIRFH